MACASLLSFLRKIASWGVAPLGYSAVADEKYTWGRIPRYLFSGGSGSGDFPLQPD